MDRSRRPTQSGPTVDQSAEPNPGPSPVLAEGEPCAQRPTPTPPGDVVSVLELCAASLALPRWQNTMCPTQVTLETGQLLIAESVHLSLGTVVYADIDRDGAFETVAILPVAARFGTNKSSRSGPVARAALRRWPRCSRTSHRSRPFRSWTHWPPETCGSPVGDYGVIVGGDPTINQYSSVRTGGTVRDSPRSPGRRPSAQPAPGRPHGDCAHPRVRCPYRVHPRRTPHRHGPEPGPKRGARRAGCSGAAFVRMVTGPNGCATAYYPSEAFQVECIIRSLAANSSKEMVFTFRAPANADALPRSL